MRAAKHSRTYFYIFFASKEAKATLLERCLAEAFQEFEESYGEEASVARFYPGSPGFRAGLRGFGIKKVPGFAISDVLYKIEEGFAPNPYISVDRGFLEGFSWDNLSDNLFNLLRDWHEVALTENVLRLGRDKVLEQSRRLFGKVWEEVREVVQVVTSAAGVIR